MLLDTQVSHEVRLIEALLRPIDDLAVSDVSRPRIELLAVRRAAALLDRALPWQRGHGRRTARLARALGLAAGLSSASLHNLELAARLHDIGLLVLHHSLASHTGCLDAQSYAAIQCHPRVGAQWLEPYRFLRNASVIIAHHHERWDGSGYPYGIRGAFIPVEARILAIADTFDAVRVPGAHDRKTRAHVAYRILKVAAGTLFDPQLVDLADTACRKWFSTTIGGHCNNDREGRA
jgi:HD-GYP domain-containing protein (c-di-GMP phosphodiesterase class II)